MWFLLIWCLEKCLKLEHLDDMKRMNTTFTYLYWYTTIYLIIWFVITYVEILEWVIQSCLVAFGSWLIASSNFLSLFFFAIEQIYPRVEPNFFFATGWMSLLMLFIGEGPIWGVIFWVYFRNSADRCHQAFQFYILALSRQKSELCRNEFQTI